MFGQKKWYNEKKWHIQIPVNQLTQQSCATVTNIIHGKKTKTFITPFQSFKNSRLRYCMTWIMTGKLEAITNLQSNSTWVILMNLTADHILDQDEGILLKEKKKFKQWNTFNIYGYWADREAARPIRKIKAILDFSEGASCLDLLQYYLCEGAIIYWPSAPFPVNACINSTIQKTINKSQY